MHASGQPLIFTLQQLDIPEQLHALCRELSALVPERLEGPWSEEEVRELIQGWRMMAFCQEDEWCAPTRFIRPMGCCIPWYSIPVRPDFSPAGMWMQVTALQMVVDHAGGLQVSIDHGAADKIHPGFF
jgi:hypothetical protein